VSKFSKILLIIFPRVFVLFLLLVIGPGVFIHKTMERELNQELPFFHSIKMALTLNYDSEEEMKFKEERTREKHHHISIYYPDDFKGLIPITKETLDWAMNKNKELFGTVKEDPVDLIIMQNEEELAELSELEEISGYYSDFEKVFAITYDNEEFITKETALYFFQKSILHEYTHYIFARLTDDVSPYPAWFKEGISEYVGEDQTSVEYSGFNLVPFVELDTLEQWSDVRLQDNTDVYTQSYFAIKYLIDKHGTGILKEIIDETNSSGDFEQGFMKATNMTVVDFQNNFLDGIEKLR
jgi:hypothetical protein